MPGRRRTDPASPVGHPAADATADHPTSPSRGRADRRRDGLLDAGIDPGRRPPAARLAPPSRPASISVDRPRPVHPAPLTRLPAAPTPTGEDIDAPRVAARPPWSPALVPVPAPAALSAPVASAQPFLGPATTLAPFQAVPAPVEHPVPTAHPSAPLPDVPRALTDPGRLGRPDAPPAAIPPRPRPSAPIVSTAEVPADPVAPVAAPATTAIPERDIAAASVAHDDDRDDGNEFDGRDDDGDGADDYDPDDYDPDDYDPDDYGDEAEGAAFDEPLAQPYEVDPDSGWHTAVTGGRAADREARREADDRRKRTDKANGKYVPKNAVEVLENDEDRAASRSRRVGALVAVVVVALLVLGVYSFASPATQEAADVQPAPTSTPSVPILSSMPPLPPLSVAPLPPADQVPSDPVRVPITVLNATDVNGLAKDVATALDGEGWPTAGTAAYSGSDIAVTTVYYDAGDDEQRTSARQMVDAHPGQVTGPVERFFDVPGVAEPGLVVVAAGDWQP